MLRGLIQVFWGPPGRKSLYGFPQSPQGQGSRWPVLMSGVPCVACSSDFIDTQTARVSKPACLLMWLQWCQTALGTGAQMDWPPLQQRRAARPRRWAQPSPWEQAGQAAAGPASACKSTARFCAPYGDRVQPALHPQGQHPCIGGQRHIYLGWREISTAKGEVS